MATYVDPRITKPIAYRLIASAIATVGDEEGSSSDIPEAPSDGNVYARKDESWQQLGSAALKNVDAFATAEQGTKADQAIPSSAMGVSVQPYSEVLQNTTASYTTEEKLKLAGLESGHFKGLYTSIEDLEAAVLNPQPGDYADVDEGEGSDVQRYIWDADDAQWVAQGGQGGVTPAQVKTMYESNPDTNVYTDAEKAKVVGLDAALADKASKSSANTFSGVQTFDAGVVEKHVTLSTGTIDLSLGNAFSLTVSENTTISITNVPASGFAGFLIELTNGGSHVITWNNAIKWPGGVAPVLTENGVDVVFLYTIDGGASWRGFVREDLK